MGTYLSLKLKSVRMANDVNDLWNKENPGYENTLHFETVKDINANIKAIKTDPDQAHLRYIQTVRAWNDNFPIWGTGTFQVKITMGDYLCSEMAKRYLEFIRKHYYLFEKEPDIEVMGILEEQAKVPHKADECLVECKYCKEMEVQNA